MRKLTVFTLATAIILICCLAAQAENEGRIYGKITTVDGDILEGLIRWDKNEASWVDVLDGNKDLDRKATKKANRKKYSDRDRGTSISIFGIELGDHETINIDWSGQAQSGIRFGHIQTMEVLGDEEVLLTLKSGEKVELANGSTDIGEGIREIVIEDADEGEIELEWDDLETIEFSSARGSEPSNFGARLYGTLTTRRGSEYTGWVCWDVDEVFESDILDGKDKRRNRKIKFGKISSIERYSSSGATVTLANGDEMVLRGTNDVDGSNRGIIISDVGFGQVRVDWDEFDRLDFKDPPRGYGYDKFDGGRAINGTVTTEDGDSYKGSIRWDNDEAYTWEILDGNYRGLEFDIEFGLIKSIEKKSYRSAIVTVQDGRTFRLRGSNDVDEDNKGIFILTNDGEEVEVEWEEFEKVQF
jgi:hypothetical protein